MGLIEEAVKLAALWLWPGICPATARDGIMLGAAVGLGFAALETAGYAFTALFTMRGVIAQQGGGDRAPARAAGPARPRAVDRHPGWRAVPHRRRGGPAAADAGGWSLVPGGGGAARAVGRCTAVAVVLTLMLTATQVQWALIRMGRVPQPTQAQVHTFTMLTWGLLLVDVLLGVAMLRGRWRQALALEHA